MRRTATAVALGLAWLTCLGVAARGVSGAGPGATARDSAKRSRGRRGRSSALWPGRIFGESRRQGPITPDPSTFHPVNREYRQAVGSTERRAAEVSRASGMRVRISAGLAGMGASRQGDCAETLSAMLSSKQLVRSAFMWIV
jgi:hypothetical protein